MAENNSGSEVLEWLQVQNVKASVQLELADISWLTECMRAGKPVEMTGKHQLVVSGMVVVPIVLFLLVSDSRSYRINTPGFSVHSLWDLGQVTSLF